MRNPYPGVTKLIDRHGRTRWRFRRKGFAMAYLPGLHGSPEFLDAYQAAAAGRPAAAGLSKTAPGSISALIAGYYESSDYKILAQSTRNTYRGVLERFRSKNGEKPATALTRANIVSNLDKMAGTPEAANLRLKCLRAVCKFAIARDMMRADPTAGMKKLRVKTDGIHSWSEAEVAQFAGFHRIGTKAHLAFAILIYTAQRRGDVVTFGRQHEIKNGSALRFRQQKTGRWMELQIVHPLRAAIDAAPKGRLTYLETDYGRPFSVAGFGNWFATKCAEAGLKGCSAHGLRKSTAAYLADRGATMHEIQSITGHRTLSEVARYTEAASQTRLAKGVAGSLARPKDEPDVV